MIVEAEQISSGSATVSGNRARVVLNLSFPNFKRVRLLLVIFGERLVQVITLHAFPLTNTNTVCTFQTPPCVRSERLRVYRQHGKWKDVKTNENS